MNNNISVEQIIKVNAPTYAKFFKIIMIIICILSLPFVLVSFGVILVACLIVFTVIMFRYYNAEYEYSLVQNELTIDRITAKSSRKRCGVYNISKTQIMTQTNSPQLENYKVNCKEHNYSSNMGTEDVYVLIVPHNNELVKLVIEPNERMLEALYKVIPNNNITQRL